MWFTNVPDLQQREAEGVDEDFFHVRCPDGHLTCISRYARDGEMGECDYPGCLQQFWFHAGEWSGYRKT